MPIPGVRKKPLDAKGRNCATPMRNVVRMSSPVAIKVLPRVGAALQHAHLAVIHAMESWRGAPVLVLEYLAGGTLADRVRRGPLPVNDVLSIFTATTEAVRHIHNAGYLHRDIKPSNLGFTLHGAPKLLDFGLVQMIADVSGSSTVTSATGGAFAATHAADGEATDCVEGRAPISPIHQHRRH